MGKSPDPSTCHPEKPLYIRATGECKGCYQVRYRATHPVTPEAIAKRRAYQRRYRLENKLKVKFQQRRKQIRLLYGLTQEQYDQMHKDHNGHCAVGKKPAKRLVVEHCHATGKVRGLACDGCNTRLGFLENPELVALAMQYLQQHGAAEAVWESLRKVEVA